MEWLRLARPHRLQRRRRIDKLGATRDMGPPIDRAAAGEASSHARAPKIAFVTGFHRSGTTVIAEALAAALPAATLTVADLAQYIPTLAQFLSELEHTEYVLDRGVDARILSGQLTEEYCWYLRARSRGRKQFAFTAEAADDLSNLALTVASRDAAERVVLKNPWDTGLEERLLTAFPSGTVLIVRRNLASVEASMRAARTRPRSRAYGQALLGETHVGLALLLWGSVMRWGPSRRIYVLGRLRIRVILLAWRLRRLPPSRTAFVSYDEMVADAYEGARWAAHLVDPTVFAREFSARHSTELTKARPVERGSLIARALDRFWERQWRQARERQSRALQSVPPDSTARH